MPPKKRGATAAAGGNAKRGRVKKDPDPDAAEDVEEEQFEESAEAADQPQAAAAQAAIEAAQATGKGKRARKPSAKQAAAAAAALEEAAEQEAAVEPAEPPPLPAATEPAADAAPTTAADAGAAAEPMADAADPAMPQQALPEQQLEQQEAQEQQQQQQPQPEQLAEMAVAAPQEDSHLQPEQQMQLQLTEEQQQLLAQQQAAEAAEALAAAEAVQAAEAELDARILEAQTKGESIQCDIALVVRADDETEQHHEPVRVHMLYDSTVADLKHRIARTNIHGQLFPAEQQDLQTLMGQGSVETMHDQIVDPHNPEATVAAKLYTHYHLMPGSQSEHMIYMRVRQGSYLDGQYAAVQGGDMVQGQTEGVELNPDGTEKKKRRHNKKWNEEETINLIRGVEILGVGHWRQMQKEFELGHRTDVDLKDKWRNITKAVGLDKKMRGVALSEDLKIRVQNCMRIQEEKRMLKAAAAGGDAPQQLAELDPMAEAAAAQAAAEGGTVQGVLEGALPPHQEQQMQGEAHLDPTLHYHAQMQAGDPSALMDAQQQEQQYAVQQDPAALQQHHPAAAMPQHEPSAAMQEQPQTQAHPASQLLDQAPQQHAPGVAEQPTQQEQQGPGENDPGSVVIPVPNFEEEQQQAGGASSELPVAPLNVI